MASGSGGHGMPCPYDGGSGALCRLNEKSTMLPCIPRPQGRRAALPIGAALVYAVSDSAACERGALGNSEWMEE